MHFSKFIAVAVSIGVLSACGGPDRARTVRSPDPSIYITVETQNGAGAISSDFTNVYVHFSEDGGSTKQVILNGEYLEDIGLSWTSAGILKVCLRGGFTNEFHNDITLELGSKFKRVQAYLEEGCSLATMKTNK